MCYNASSKFLEYSLAFVLVLDMEVAFEVEFCTFRIKLSSGFLNIYILIFCIIYKEYSWMSS